MNWADLAPLIGDAAPTLGRILGGALPLPFGEDIGGAVGNAIASAIGAQPNPDSIASTLGATPNDVKIAQLKDLEKQAADKWRALSSIAKSEAAVGVASEQATAATMQAELISGTWYQKIPRPLGMFVWIASWPFQLGAILYVFFSHDPALIAASSGIVYAICAWNASPAAFAGVYAYGRSQEKIAAMGNGNGH